MNEFVIIKHELLKRFGTSGTRVYPRDLDVISQVVSRVRETSSTRKTYFLHGFQWLLTRPHACDEYEGETVVLVC